MLPLLSFVNRLVSQFQCSFAYLHVLEKSSKSRNSRDQTRLNQFNEREMQMFSLATMLLSPRKSSRLRSFFLISVFFFVVFLEAYARDGYRRCNLSLLLSLVLFLHCENVGRTGVSSPFSLRLLVPGLFSDVLTMQACSPRSCNENLLANSRNGERGVNSNELLRY